MNLGQIITRLTPEEAEATRGIDTGIKRDGRQLKIKQESAGTMPADSCLMEPNFDCLVTKSECIHATLNIGNQARRYVDQSILLLNLARVGPMNIPNFIRTPTFGQQEIKAKRSIGMSEIVWIVGAGIVALLLIAWFGLQVKPAPFVAFPQHSSAVETMPLPTNLPAPVVRFLSCGVRRANSRDYVSSDFGERRYAPVWTHHSPRVVPLYSRGG